MATVSGGEVDRRYRAIRGALEREGIDAVVVSGSEYTGFDGAVLYTSGFQIVHRYAYVLIPLEGEPSIVFPSEARYVGEHGATWIDERLFVDTPGEWLRERVQARRWTRIGVYGLEYVMNVRDYNALSSGGFELVPFDVPFDLARAVKSGAELESVRESVRINEEGFWTVLAAYEPGKTEAEIMAPAAARFVELGTGRHAMNMVLAHGPPGGARPEFVIPSETRAVEPNDLLLYSLEIAGPGGHWAEVSRPIMRGAPSWETAAMLEAYVEYGQTARRAMRAGATAHDVHVACSSPFREGGFRLGHVTGHSIGMTMIEHPRIGEGSDVELREDMTLSMHPHVIAEDGSCLYFQETWRVGAHEGEQLSGLAYAIFDGSEERRPRAFG
jgi:Xaa-Pro aminopeptidase